MTTRGNPTKRDLEDRGASQAKPRLMWRIPQAGETKKFRMTRAI